MSLVDFNKFAKEKKFDDLYLVSYYEKKTEEEIDEIVKDKSFMALSGYYDFIDETKEILKKYQVPEDQLEKAINEIVRNNIANTCKMSSLTIAQKQRNGKFKSLETQELIEARIIYSELLVNYCSTNDMQILTQKNGDIVVDFKSEEVAQNTFDDFYAEAEKYE